MVVELKPPPQRRVKRALEALFREARMLERRRRRRHALLALLALLACAVVAAAAFLVVAASGGSGTSSGSKPSLAASGLLGAQVVPKDPSSLAVGPGGVLYIGDPGRHQVLVRLANGRFRVAVGNGVAGVAGDRGSALRAEIDDPLSLLVSRTGDLYIFDGEDTTSISSGFTAEVREVAPDGRITTLVGACGGVDAAAGAIARAALETPSGAIGPNGDLYLDGQACGAGAQGPVLELTAGGHLIDAPFDAILREQSCLPPSGITFSGSGALYAACDSGQGHGKELLIVQRDGSSNAFSGVYPYDDEAGVATEPDGTVVAGDYFKIVRVTPQGVHTIINLDGTNHDGFLGSFHGIAGSMEPNAVVVDRHGNIYLAATSGFGNGTFTGIIEVNTDGHVQVLWSRPTT
jgi:hypothetical protein